MVPGKPNATFHKIAQTMPATEGPPVKADSAIDPNGLLPRRRLYFRYEGSRLKRRHEAGNDAPRAGLFRTEGARRSVPESLCSNEIAELRHRDAARRGQADRSCQRSHRCKRR